MKIKTKNKKVDIVRVSLEYSEDSLKNYSFDELLNNEEINNKDLTINYKNVNFSIVNEDDEVLIGRIRTSIDKGLPPKFNRDTKEINPLDLGDNEDLAYGNIILYSKKYKCLFFEVNKYSIYLDVFKNYIYECWKNSVLLKTECTFNLQFVTILKRNETQRALNFDIFKSLKIKIYQPAEFLEEFRNQDLTLEDKIRYDIESKLQSSAELNAEYVDFEYFVNYAKNKGRGLNIQYSGKLINTFSNIIRVPSLKKNIQVFDVAGYTSEDNHLIPINILGDIYSSKIKLTEPRLDSDLQISERTEKIKNLYISEVSNLESYL